MTTNHNRKDDFKPLNNNDYTTSWDGFPQRNANGEQKYQHNLAVLRTRQRLPLWNYLNSIGYFVRYVQTTEDADYFHCLDRANGTDVLFHGAQDNSYLIKHDDESGWNILTDNVPGTKHWSNHTKRLG